MKSNINLHIHTTFSDGKKTVSQIVDELKNADVKYFSITDHDEVIGNIEAAKLAYEYKMRYINGIELSSCFNGEIGYDATYVCHIIGLGFDYRKMLQEIEKIKIAKDVKMVALYNNLLSEGYNLDFKNVYIEGRIPERKIIAYELVNKGYAKDNDEAFLKILNSEKFRKYAENLPTIKQAVEIIHSCNGFAIWAHPFGIARGGKKELTYEQVAELSKSMLNYKIDALEVYYQEYSIEKIQYLENLATEMKLLKSIGTDYHGIVSEKEEDIKNNDDKIKEQIWFEKEDLVIDYGIKKIIVKKQPEQLEAEIKKAEGH